MKHGAGQITRAVAATVACLMFATPLAAQENTQVAGYETYAVVAPVSRESAARPFAERHCAKYDRFAYFRRMDGISAIFDCTVGKREPPRSTPTFSGRGIY